MIYTEEGLFPGACAGAENAPGFCRVCLCGSVHWIRASICHRTRSQRPCVGDRLKRRVAARCSAMGSAAASVRRCGSVPRSGQRKPETETNTFRNSAKIVFEKSVVFTPSALLPVLSCLACLRCHGFPRRLAGSAAVF